MMKYFEMFKKAEELTKRAEASLSHRYKEVYSVFIVVGDEDKELYFVDIEVGGGVGSGMYRRFRGMATEEQILKMYC